MRLGQVRVFRRDDHNSVPERLVLAIRVIPEAGRDDISLSDVAEGVPQRCLVIAEQEVHPGALHLLAIHCCANSSITSTSIRRPVNFPANAAASTARRSA